MRTNEELWKKVKAELLRKNGGQWTARLAQQCVQEYKRRGGTYVGAKDPNNSLAVWTKQDWGYAGKEGASRYLPAKVREEASPSLLKKENRLKGTKLGQNIPYTKELKDLMRRST